MRSKIKSNWITLACLGLIVALSFISGCKDDEPSSNEYVNDWILANMEYVYLWNDDIPTKPNKSQSPDLFFNSLLSDEDRFSWIEENYEELLNSLQGVNKEAGYEFILYYESSTSQNIIAQVAYIKTGSPADARDLERGDVITHINGQQMTASNYSTLLEKTRENHTIKYSRYNFATEQFEDKGTLSLTTVEFAENPNHIHQVIDAGGGRKVGYYVYNFFAAGPTTSSTQYDNEMNEIFSDFKTEGITDLILDLRFNSGGAESSTIKLASLIGTGVTSDDIFTIREYNDIVTEEIMDDPGGGPEFFNRKFANEANNIGSQLTSNRVYILTKNRTASASELLINGLKPYMDVFIIGDTTIGKNVGSISIWKEDDPKNTWGMQPIVVKSYNSDHESDYSEGFIPNIADDDNSLVLYPLGDPDENLLNIALGEITGAGRKKDLASRKKAGPMIGTSMDRKHWKFNLLIDDDRLKKLILNKQEQF